MKQPDAQNPVDAKSDPAGKSAAEDWTRLLFAQANPHAPFAAAEALAAAATRTLQLSYNLALAGRVLDLAGLDQLIGRLTASILDLDAPDGRRLRTVLSGVLDRLDRLEHAITRQMPSSSVL